MSSARPPEGAQVSPGDAVRSATALPSGPPAANASAAIPFKPAEDPSLPSGPQWGLAIVLCMAALGAALWVLRRRGNTANGWRRQGGLLNVVETRALSAQVQLNVVRYGGRQLLLSVGPAGTQCLRDDPAEEGQAP
jgi:Flagellar biosynthesis protein, FliO